MRIGQQTNRTVSHGDCISIRFTETETLAACFVSNEAVDLDHGIPAGLDADERREYAAERHIFRPHQVEALRQAAHEYLRDPLGERALVLELSLSLDRALASNG